MHKPIPHNQQIHVCPQETIQCIIRHAHDGLIFIERIIEQHGNLSKADDYVVATGETHSVREFVEEAFKVAELDYSRFLKIDEMYIRPKDVDLLCSDCSKLKTMTGWQTKTTFKYLVKIMVDADIERWSSYLTGKMFPWDALNYPGDIKFLKRHMNKSAN